MEQKFGLIRCTETHKPLFAAQQLRGPEEAAAATACAPAAAAGALVVAPPATPASAAAFGPARRPRPRPPLAPPASSPERRTRLRSRPPACPTTTSNSKRVFLSREDHYYAYASHNDSSTPASSDKNIYTNMLRGCSHSSPYQIRLSREGVFRGWEQRRGRLPWNSNVLTTEKGLGG
eukprot:XP_020404510.1 myc-associated zinc finger protein-like [Zea mays]